MDLRSIDLNSVLTRHASEKVAYKPGLDYLLECFLPSTFARIIRVLPGELPGPYAYVETLTTMKHLKTKAKLTPIYLLSFNYQQALGYPACRAFLYFEWKNRLDTIRLAAELSGKRPLFKSNNLAYYEWKPICTHYFLIEISLLIELSLLYPTRSIFAWKFLFLLESLKAEKTVLKRF